MPSVEGLRYVAPPFPSQLRLDTTTECNASCLSCHRAYSKRQGQMPMELIDQLLDDVSKWERPIKEIVPVGYGEFFIRKDWFEILQKITTKLPYTVIVIPTNGSLIDTDMVYKLAKIPTLKIINFSVNAFFDETYQNFMKLNPNVIIKIRRAIPQIRILRRDINIWVSMVFDPAYQTDFEKDEFIKYWISCSYPQILPAASAGRPDQKPSNPVKLPCRSIFSDIVVGYDGKISSCCFDANFTLDLGYYKGDLRKSWRGRKLNALRLAHNEHRREEYSLCKRCTFA